MATGLLFEFIHPLPTVFNVKIDRFVSIKGASAICSRSSYGFGATTPTGQDPWSVARTTTGTLPALHRIEHCGFLSRSWLKSGDGGRNAARMPAIAIFG